MFIACHLANLEYDLTRLGGMLDRNPNLFLDISARFAEVAPIPRAVNAFLRKYPDRVLYGTDMPYTQKIFSTTFRSDQGAMLAANYSVTSAVAALSLGRPLAGSVPNVTVNLITPGTLYGDRVNELDFRIAKVLRFGRTRSNIGFDIYNVLNANPVLTYNQAFTPISAANPNGQWLVPTSVLQSRFVKFSASVDF